MTQATMDAVFRENGLYDRIMASVRQGRNFDGPDGRKFERLVNDLKEDHSLEEIDQYDALHGLFHIYMLMAMPVAKREMMECLSEFGLEYIQLKIATTFQYELKDMPVELLLPSAQSYMTLMA